MTKEALGPTAQEIAISVGMAIYARMMRTARDNSQTVGEKHDYYITMEQLEDAFVNLREELGVRPWRPVEASAPAAPPADELLRIVADPRVPTNASQRLPKTIYGRYLAGETVKELAEDYGLPQEQIEWGIRIGHLLAAPPTDAELRELRASLKAEVVGNNGMMFQRWTDDGIERIIQLARSAREKELEGK